MRRRAWLLLATASALNLPGRRLRQRLRAATLDPAPENTWDATDETYDPRDSAINLALLDEPLELPETPSRPKILAFAAPVAVLNLSAFDLDDVLERRPTFLEPEYPFEWTGVYSLEAGSYELSLAEGPDPEMSLVVVADQEGNDGALREGAEWCLRRYAESAEAIEPGGTIPLGEHVNLQLDSPGRKSFTLNVDRQVRVGLFTQHTAEEFDIQLLRNGTTITHEAERTWVAQHEHDDDVGSIAIETDGDVDPSRFNDWLSELLQVHGVDIFRMKGFIAIAGDPRRYVFQGVHMLFDSQPDKPWDDAPRRNQVVFIGRNLDEEGMRAGFEACLV